MIDIDLWDDSVKPKAHHAGKVLLRDLWLTNDEQTVGILLNQCFETLNMSDLRKEMSYGAMLGVMAVVMNKFKNNSDIQTTCCQFISNIAPEINEGFFFMEEVIDIELIRCILQCTTQFPNVWEIQVSFLTLFAFFTDDSNQDGIKLLMDEYEYGEANCKRF
jgi:hypothetical protein